MQPIALNFELDIHKISENQNGKWIVEGLASTSDLDFQDDIVSQRAIDESAKDLIQSSTVLYNHDLNQAIGKILESRAVKNGLWIKVFISKTAPLIWEQIKEGVINKFSIRGKILDAKKHWVQDLKKWVQIILKMRLAEVSLVSVPANPNAKTLRWYVSKALHNFYNDGGDLDILKTGGNQMNNNTNSLDYLEEFLKAEKNNNANQCGCHQYQKQVDENGELPQSKNTVKAGNGVIEMLNEAIRMAKDDKLKQLLNELKTRLEKYPKPEPGKNLPSNSIKTYDENHNIDAELGVNLEPTYNQLADNTNSDVNEIIANVLSALNGQKTEPDFNDEPNVVKSGAKLSKQSQTELNKVISKLNEAIEMIKILVGKTNDESVKNLLNKFNEVKSYFENQTKNTMGDTHDAFEKLLDIQSKLANKTIQTDEKVSKTIELLEKILTGVGVVRNEDGTISTGKNAVKGIDNRVVKESDINDSISKITETEDYQKSSIESQRQILTDAIGDIISKGGKK